MIDRDGDGYINSQDLQTLMQSLGGNPTESEVQEMIHEVDEEGKGAINFKEFLKMMAIKLKSTNDEEEDIREAFKIFDKDSNGFVTVEEMKTVLSNFGMSLPLDEIVDMFKTADFDGDGMLSIVEFTALMKGNEIMQEELKNEEKEIVEKSDEDEEVEVEKLQESKKSRVTFELPSTSRKS